MRAHGVTLVSQEDPHRTVQTFIDLVQRHEQAFYSFVHKVHSKGEGLFDSLMRWIELFLTVVREGLGEPISLEFILPHVGQERTAILAEVDAVAMYHYKLKVAYEDKIRRRFGKVQGQTGADAEDEATQALVQGVVGEISFGELVQGDADDLAAEETDDNDVSSSEYETDADSETDESNEIPTRSVARSQTVTQHERQLHRKRSQPQMANNRDRPRPRSLSLKNSQSILSPRFSHDVPPVPSLPNIPFAKPLPPSPAPESTQPFPTLVASRLPKSANPPTQRPRRAPSPMQPRKGKGKKAPESLKPPPLQHIPTLLPVFTELVSLGMLFTFKYATHEISLDTTITSP